jgi:hypothetical protein
VTADRQQAEVFFDITTLEALPDAGLADRMAAYVDRIRDLYPEAKGPG